MKKWKGWAYVSDLDILGDIWLEDTDTTTTDESVEDIDVFWKEDKTPVEEPKVEEVVVEEPKVEEPVVVEETSTPDNKEGEEDIEKWLDDLLKSSTEVDNKVDEVKDAVQESWDENAMKLVDELQTLMAEKNLEIEQLKKQVDVSNNRYLTKFGEEEELSLYRPEIEKLQNNPRLMALIKYSDTENEKIKPKIVSILSDMIYKLTWQDVSDLLDEKDRAAINVLNTPASDNPPMNTPIPQEDKNVDYEESVNNILWF